MRLLLAKSFQLPAQLRVVERQDRCGKECGISRTGFANRSQSLAKRFRTKLAEWYGKDQADKIQYAEAFEVCEYGRRPNKEETTRLFPFLGE